MPNSKSAKRPREASGTLLTLGRLGFEGASESGASRLLGQPKRLGVLLYLLLSQRGGALTRDKVLSVFWPESDAGRARNALRQTISFVRTCLGEDSLVSVGTHGLTVAKTLQCDAATFEILLDAGRKEDALQLYSGELLPGFHVAGSTEFSLWLDERRRHLSNRAAKAAWDLSSERESKGDLAAAAFWGKRALALSPFSESEVQRLLRLLARTRDFAEALRAYQGLERALHAEFGVRPSAETIALAELIREKLNAEAAAKAAGSRRNTGDRRQAGRRVGLGDYSGPDRRGKGDRRVGDRRTGIDRRTLQ